MSKLILITGPMAAGKSTVAQLVAERLMPAVHLRGDVFRRMIVSGRIDMSPEAPPEALAQLRLRYRMTRDAARTYHENGFSVVVQDTIVGPILREVIALYRDLPLIVVVLCPDVETIATREAARNKQAYTGFSVEAFHDLFEKQTPRIGTWLDTSQQTAAETAREVLQRVGA